jgi:hypothetical protein
MHQNLRACFVIHESPVYPRECSHDLIRGDVEQVSEFFEFFSFHRASFLLDTRIQFQQRFLNCRLEFLGMIIVSTAEWLAKSSFLSANLMVPSAVVTFPDQQQSESQRSGENGRCRTVAISC